MSTHRPSDQPVVDITAEERALHDLLLDVVPDHPADCRICATATTDQQGATVAEITQADVEAAVTAALATQKTTHDAAIADLEAKLAARDTDDKVADIQGRLDVAVAAQKAAEDKLAGTVAFLQAEADKVADAERVATAKTERAAAVKDLKVFPDEYVDANADRWAAMDADTWSGQLADLAAIKPAVTDALGGTGNPATDHKDPQGSPLTGRVTDASGTGGDDQGDAFQDVLANRHAIAGMF